MTNAPSDNQRRRMMKLLAAAASAALVPHAAQATDSNFPIFDALLFHGKPNLARLGLNPMWAVSDIWRPGIQKDTVDREGIIAALQRLPAGAFTIFIDIENWLLEGPQAVVARSVENYLRTAEIIRTYSPSIKFGFYGIAPTFTYWPILRGEAGQLNSWHAVNRALQPLSNSVDFVLPCLYTFDDDPDRWRRFAQATIHEARQYNKPVFPFLWNEYFDANPQLRGQQVRGEDWRGELQACRTQADGVVLWGGNERNWSESAEWWQSVLKFQRSSAGASAAAR